MHNEMSLSIAQRLGSNLRDILYQLSGISNCVERLNRENRDQAGYIYVGKLCLNVVKLREIFDGQINFLIEDFNNTKNYINTVSGDRHMEFLVDLEGDIDEINQVYLKIAEIGSNNVTWSTKVSLIKTQLPNLEKRIAQSIESITHRSRFNHNFSHCFEKHAA